MVPKRANMFFLFGGTTTSNGPRHVGISKSPTCPSAFGSANDSDTLP